MKKRKFSTFFAVAVFCTAAVSGGTQQEDTHKRPSMDSILKFEQQTVTVDDFAAEGFILDIGGGGEGVIGQLKGRQVIAIDIRKRELEEAPPGPLKIVMDARDLKFLDDVFNTATVFFTFMYIAPGDHQKVFEELLRVIKPGGRLLIWDVIFPAVTDEKKTMAIFPFHFILPDKEIRTGYGVRLPEGEQGLAHFVELAEKNGFQIVTHKEKDSWFFLEARKPDN